VHGAGGLRAGRHDGGEGAAGHAATVP
jgi:hypothetical protein